MNNKVTFWVGIASLVLMIVCECIFPDPASVSYWVAVAFTAILVIAFIVLGIKIYRK